MEHPGPNENGSHLAHPGPNENGSHLAHRIAHNYKAGNDGDLQYHHHDGANRADDFHCELDFFHFAHFFSLRKSSKALHPRSLDPWRQNRPDRPALNISRYLAPVHVGICASGRIYQPPRLRVYHAIRDRFFLSETLRQNRNLDLRVRKRSVILDKRVIAANETVSKLRAGLDVASRRNPAESASDARIAFLLQFSLAGKLPDVENLQAVKKVKFRAGQIAVGLVDHAQIETGIVSRDGLHTVAEKIRSQRAENLSPRAHGNCASL